MPVAGHHGTDRPRRPRKTSPFGQLAVAERFAVPDRSARPNDGLLKFGHTIEHQSGLEPNPGRSLEIPLNGFLKWWMGAIVFDRAEIRTQARKMAIEIRLIGEFRFEDPFSLHDEEKRPPRGWYETVADHGGPFY